MATKPPPKKPPTPAPQTPVSHQLLLTPLPRGVVERDGALKLRLSVFVGIRLFFNGTNQRSLANWGDFVNWPQALAERVNSWNLLFTREKPAGGDVKVKASLDPETPAPDPELWSLLFPESTPVTSYDFEMQMKNLDKKKVIDYNQGALLEYLKEKYVEVANEIEIPIIDGPTDLFEHYAELQGLTDPSAAIVKKEMNAIATKYTHRDAIKTLADGRTTQEFVRFMIARAPTTAPLNPVKKQSRAAREGKQALQRLGIQQPIPERTTNLANYYKVKRPARPVAPDLDFHGGLAGLSNHPQLMRKLGLVIDLEVSLPPALAAGIDEATVSVQLDWAPGTSLNPVGRLRTRCAVGKNGFEALSRKPGSDYDSDPELAGGMLALRSDLRRQERQQVHKALHAEPGRRRWCLAEDPVLRRGSQQRSRSRARPQRPAAAARLQVSRALGRPYRPRRCALVPAQPSADDEQHGLQSEPVHPQSRGHHTRLLLRRLRRSVGCVVSALPPPGPSPVHARSGQTTGGARARGRLGLDRPHAEQGGRRHQRAREPADRALRRQAEDLVAPRPGLKLDPDELPPDPDKASPENTTNLKLEVSYEAVPGTLPPQRFGRGYYLRARAVDLAGNPTPVERADATGLDHALGRHLEGNSLEPEVYRRFEPVPPPAVIPRELMTEGESSDVLVIRTNWDLQSNSDVAIRHIFPPSIDQFSAEAHGVLDKPGVGLDPDAFEMLQARAGRTVDEPHPAAKADPRNHDAPYLDTDSPLWKVEGGDRGDLARFPGLPDPLSRSAAFLGLPGMAPGTVKRCSFETGRPWPEVVPLRLEVYESENFVEPQLIETEDRFGIVRVLRVGLPKGGDFEVSLSSAFNPEDLNKLGIWDWIEAKSALVDSTVNGGHWAITPARKLRLINATRQPLVPTEFSGLHLAKGIGDTHVTLLDTMKTSRHTTERVDVRASWNDIIDHIDPNAEDPKKAWQPRHPVPGAAVVFQKPIELDPARNGELPIAERQDIHHTRHLAQIDYSTEAATRFAEYFEYKTRNLNLNQGQDVVDSDGVVPGTETVVNAVGVPTVNERGVNRDGLSERKDHRYRRRLRKPRDGGSGHGQIPGGADHPQESRSDRARGIALGAELSAPRGSEGALRGSELQVGAGRAAQRGSLPPRRWDYSRLPRPPLVVLGRR